MRSLVAIAMLVASIQVAQAQEAPEGSETTIQCTLNADGTSSCQ